MENKNDVNQNINEKLDSTSNILRNKSAVIDATSIKEIKNELDPNNPLNISVIWVDSNINSDENQEYLIKLKNLNVKLVVCSSVDESVKIVYNTKNVFIIVSGSLGKILMGKIHYSDRILKAFVFCSNIDFHKKWSINFNKIKNVENDFQMILNAITSELLFYKRNFINSSSIKLKSGFHFDNNQSYIDYIYLDFIFKLVQEKTVIYLKEAKIDFEEFSTSFILKNNNQHYQSKQLDFLELFLKECDGDVKDENILR